MNYNELLNKMSGKISAASIEAALIFPDILFKSSL